MSVCAKCGESAARLYGPKLDACLVCWSPPGGPESVEEPLVPTLEQCENVALTLGFPVLISALRPPYYEESLRNLHALVARAAMGDQEAASTLAVLRRSFAHTGASA